MRLVWTWVVSDSGITTTQAAVLYLVHRHTSSPTAFFLAQYMKVERLQLENNTSLSDSFNPSGTRLANKGHESGYFERPLSN